MVNTLESMATSDYKALLSRYNKANEYYTKLTKEEVIRDKFYNEYLRIIDNIKSYEQLFEKWKYEGNEKFLRLL